MTKGPLPIFLLLLAFLLSAWGNVIAAAFCPRYLSRNGHIDHGPRQAKQIEPKSCHHAMAQMETGDMQMDDMQMENDSAAESEIIATSDNLPITASTESVDEQIALNVPAEPCGHCWMHSQPPTGSGTLAAVNPSPQSVGTDAPPADFAIALSSAYVVPITPSEHGPPGNSFPRHILINIFRI